jgi:hypothetical protein
MGNTPYVPTPMIRVQLRSDCEYLIDIYYRFYADADVREGIDSTRRLMGSGFSGSIAIRYLWEDAIQ